MSADGFDGAVAAQIREAIQFLKPGASWSCDVDTHALVIIRRDVPKYLVSCRSCRSLLVLDCTPRSILVHINKHTEGKPLT